MRALLVIVSAFVVAAISHRGSPKSFSNVDMLTIPLHRRVRSASKLSALEVSQTGSHDRGNGRVQLQEQRHIYSGPLRLGRQDQVLTVVFDTGSANLVVPSASCESRGCHGRDDRHLFDSRASSSGTFVSSSGESTNYDNARHFALTFASGKASGVAFEDSVCLGWTESGAMGICAKQAKFLLAEWESDDFVDFDFDGILGLAPDGPLSAGAGFSIVDELVSEGVLSQRLFAFYLSADDDDASEVSFGGYDTGRVRDNLTWLKVNAGKGSWEVPVHDISVNGTHQGLRQCTAFLGRCVAVLDTGCSGIGLPKGMAGDLATQIGFKGDRFQCADPAIVLPNIGFVLDGHNFELSPKDYVEVSPKDPESCRLRFDDVSDSKYSFLLGHPFLQRYYSIYDQDKLQVGLSRTERPSEQKSEPGPAEVAMTKMLAQASR